MRRGLFPVALAGAALCCTPAWGETLDEAIAASLAHSPALAAAEAREDAADAAVAEARAQRMPSATVQGQFGAGWIDPQGFFGLSADDVVPRTAQLTVELPIFTGGRIAAARTRAALSQTLAREARRQAALALRIEVISAYSAALAASRETASYAKLDEALAEVVRHAQLKFGVGEGTSTELAQAKARKAEAEAGLAAAHGKLDAALARLRLLAGRPMAPEADLPVAPESPATAEEAVSLALAHNPALAQAHSAAAMARSGISAARAEGMPSVGLYAEGASVRDQFFPGYKADSASAGVRAKWTFFSGGRVAAAVSKAEAEARAGDADAEAAAEQVERAAIEGFVAVRSAKAQLAASEARVAATNEALRGIRLEAQVGAKPQLALLDAEREAIAAESAWIDAETRLLVAVHVLRAIMGQDDE